jgi:hypothetical protein
MKAQRDLIRFVTFKISVAHARFNSEVSIEDDEVAATWFGMMKTVLPLLVTGEVDVGWVGKDRCYITPIRTMAVEAFSSALGDALVEARTRFSSDVARELTAYEEIRGLLPGLMSGELGFGYHSGPKPIGQPVVWSAKRGGAR